MKHNQNKIKALNDRNLLAYAGEGGDTFVSAEYVQKNMQLYTIRNSLPLPTRPTACRRIRHRRRARKALLWIDRLAVMAEEPFAAHGHGAYFCLSLMDRLYKPDMDVERAKDLLRKCIQELKVRFLVNFTAFTVKLVSCYNELAIALN